MIEEQLNEVCATMAREIIDLYAKFCTKVPKSMVIAAITGALAACAFEGGFPREKVIEALNSTFDIVEDGEPK